ncbi:uncharacterized protein LOC144862435 [Branchiostoma floridae x Branchiostoma japonicum]
MDVMEETVWERRRKKLLQLYQDRYVREPTSLRNYINSDNRSISNYTSSGEDFGRQDSYPDQYLTSRRTSLNTSERSSTDVFFEKDFGQRDLHRDRYLSPGRRYSQTSDRTVSDELSAERPGHPQYLTPLPSYVKRAWSPSNDDVSEDNVSYGDGYIALS